MKRFGKVFFATLAIGFMANMANAVSLVDYWTLDPDGTDSSTVINSVADRPTAKLKNWGGTNLGGGWSIEAATDLSYSTGSFKFDANQLLYFRLSSRDGYDGVGTDSFSISMWVNPSQLPHSANMQIFAPRDWDERNPLGSRISINSISGKVRIDNSLNESETIDTGATVPLTTDSVDAPWSQLTFVFENSTIATYLNGDYVSTTSDCTVNYSAIEQSLSFGGNTQKVIDAWGYECSEDIGYYYSGYMDDIAVWDSALLPSEIQALASGVSPIVLQETTSPNIPGDANKDGKVDGSDVTILAGNWQTLSGATWAMGDFNGDGRVDGSDVTILAGNWQHGTGTTAASVPEPSTLIGLFTLCLAGLLRFSRRSRRLP